jgi:hypothetical protein
VSCDDTPLHDDILRDRIHSAGWFLLKRSSEERLHTTEFFIISHQFVITDRCLVACSRRLQYFSTRLVDYSTAEDSDSGRSYATHHPRCSRSPRCFKTSVRYVLLLPDAAPRIKNSCSCGDKTDAVAARRRNCNRNLH